ncbi:hypothetical protein OSW16_10745 [Pseudomonas putida]|uniref:hypothetical protein n=1 Tax=Pseudomonas putida TaxID=303 RepID=UPI00226F387B|nr:hypothetical protein [Pseudomonas putida]WAC00087.1 hypothetical protein OSW16_10745 [Pseudomonas putida]
MLHAFNQKKSLLFQRYLGIRDDPEERRISAEDEITSLIMGPLAFLDATTIVSFWEALIKLYNPEISFPSTAPTRAQMEFWPKRCNIEPDLYVKLWWGEETRILLVEFKWRAPLSGEAQLHNQWQRFLTPEEQMSAYHLFIGLDSAEAHNACARQDVWQGKLLARNWFDVMTILNRSAPSANDGFTLWRHQVMAFFSLVRVPTFRGFSSIEQPSLSVPVGPLFFSSVSNFKAHL